jgi:hypothetical protein
MIVVGPKQCIDSDGWGVDPGEAVLEYEVLQGGQSKWEERRFLGEAPEADALPCSAYGSRSGHQFDAPA